MFISLNLYCLAETQTRWLEIQIGEKCLRRGYLTRVCGSFDNQDDRFVIDIQAERHIDSFK